MKALKACVAVLAVGSLLVGCGSEWEDDVRFKVIEISPRTNLTRTETIGNHFRLELDQEKPDSVAPFSHAAVTDEQVPEGTEVGDVLMCKVRQWDENSFDGVGLQTDTGPCRTP
ncbi:hypothetical protein ACFFSW_33795 [Saccharothrix longispora]|uniref:Lipoprotein n=1 Tax=Saccharothrix longispora TaxID=33920 RepID=A0ABU1Q2K4_9PSEU|nr:hypothetical protein [Saccharothrix longispora]MDR6597121.1 hypothetical protein [Saccharothrix longispora]